MSLRCRLSAILRLMCSTDAISRNLSSPPRSNQFLPDQATDAEDASRDWFRNCAIAQYILFLAAGAVGIASAATSFCLKVQCRPMRTIQR